MGAKEGWRIIGKPASVICIVFMPTTITLTIVRLTTISQPQPSKRKLFIPCVHCAATTFTWQCYSWTTMFFVRDHVTIPCKKWSWVHNKTAIVTSVTSSCRQPSHRPLLYQQPSHWMSLHRHHQNGNSSSDNHNSVRIAGGDFFHNKRCSHWTRVFHWCEYLQIAKGPKTREILFFSDANMKP